MPRSSDRIYHLARADQHREQAAKAATSHARAAHVAMARHHDLLSSAAARAERLVDADSS